MRRIRTNIKKITVFIFVLCMALTGTSCSSKKNNNSSKVDSAENEVTLTFFGNVNATEKIRPIEDLIHEYMDDNPNVTIIYEGLAPDANIDYNEILSKRLANGNGDDIFFSYAGYLPTLARQGYVTSLDSLESWSEYRDNDKDGLSIDGHFYGIPMETTVVGLYCNMTVLQKYNLEAPEDYDTFLQDCDTLLKAGVQPIAASQLIPFSGYAYADGLSEIYRSENSALIVDNIKNQKEKVSGYFEKGFGNLNSLLDSGYIDRDSTLSAGTTENAEKMFANGECAFLLGASDLNASIKHNNPDADYQIYPIPIFDGEGVCLTTPDHLLCVNEASPNKEIALDFVKFCTEKQNIEVYVKSQGSISPLKGEMVQSEHMTKVLQKIENGESISSVDYGMGVRLQNWVQKAGISMLNGANVDEVKEDLDEFVKGELDDSK